MLDHSQENNTVLPDDILLGQFIHEGSENAFQTLVERYGPFVLSTCRRGAPSASDADDAFQATFLILTQSANKVRSRASLSAWLYGVACRVCARLRRDRARHGAVPLIDIIDDDPDPLDELLARHDELVTDEELALLPEKLRSPLILRYLVGKNNVTVAEELGITVAALEGRLKRAKKQLRLRLIRRGVTLAAAVATLKATRVAAGQVPPWLLTQTTETCFDIQPSQTSLPNASKNPVAQLAIEETHLMNTLFFSKPASIAATLATAATLIIGVPLAISQGTSREGGTSPLPLAVESIHQTATNTDDSVRIGVAKTSDRRTKPADSLSERTTTHRLEATTKSEDESESFPQRNAEKRIVPPRAYEPTQHPAPNPWKNPNPQTHPPIRQQESYVSPSDPSENRRNSLDLVPLSASNTKTQQILPSIQQQDPYDRSSDPSENRHNPLDLVRRTASEVKIQQALLMPVKQLDYQETPLIEILDVLSDEFQVPILVDRPRLDELGVSEEIEISIQLPGVQLKSALRLILRDLELTYLVRDEVLLITSRDEAESVLETRVYPISQFNLGATELIDTIVSTVARDTWQENGNGEGAIADVESGLVISQTDSVHEQIQQLLEQLLRLHEE